MDDNRVEKNNSSGISPIKHSTRETDVMGPLFPALIALVAGLCVAGPLIGRLLHRMGHKTLGWLLIETSTVEEKRSF